MSKRPPKPAKDYKAIIAAKAEGSGWMSAAEIAMAKEYAHHDIDEKCAHSGLSAHAAMDANRFISHLIDSVATLPLDEGCRYFTGDHLHRKGLKSLKDAEIEGLHKSYRERTDTDHHGRHGHHGHHGHGHHHKRNDFEEMLKNTWKNTLAGMRASLEIKLAKKGAAAER